VVIYLSIPYYSNCKVDVYLFDENDNLITYDRHNDDKETRVNNRKKLRAFYINSSLDSEGNFIPAPKLKKVVIIPRYSKLYSDYPMAVSNYSKIFNNSYNELLNYQVRDVVAKTNKYYFTTNFASKRFIVTQLAYEKGFKVKVLDYLPGDTAGAKSVTLSITGPYAYGLLKGEKGVHRLVRISPFDSNSRRHTSFCSCDIAPEIANNNEIVIKDEDIRVDVFRSSGAGGQSVNTTDSAVRITHLPTNIVVTCQNERSQIKNREVALNVLKSKLLELEIKRQEEEMKSIKGENMNINFGSQIRSYVFCPYTLVKDHRTDYEMGNVNAVMDGDIEGFMISYLKMMAGKQNE
jgi:protein subunit release factor B